MPDTAVHKTTRPSKGILAGPARRHEHQRAGHRDDRCRLAAPGHSRERKHGGTTFSFNLNQRATVVFTFTQRGHKRSLGRLTIVGHPGRNKVAFNGHINRHTNLKPGTYTVTVKAGPSTQRLTFTIVK